MKVNTLLNLLYLYIFKIKLVSFNNDDNSFFSYKLIHFLPFILFNSYMKEQKFLKIIENSIGKEFVGDDCAYIKDLGIVISQDSLVENIHFKRKWYSPSELGYKSVAVNISDILASGGEPAFITIGLSLPNNISEKFVEDFYKGAKKALHGAKIIGGDITGSKKDIFISITAIGTDKGRRISSRKNAKIGYVIITTGSHGSSSAGLRELINNGNNQELIFAHKTPILEENFSRQISENINTDYAMMDTSDGLADALFKIAEESNVKIVAEYSKIPHSNLVSREDVLFGGEDYKLVAAVPADFAKNLPNVVIIGNVYPYDGIRLRIDNEIFSNYDDLKVYNHFN